PNEGDTLAALDGVRFIRVTHPAPRMPVLYEPSIIVVCQGRKLGYLGDRFGRKRSLLATLMLMAVSTVAIGLLPTHAQAGVVAPILLVLMRVLQGIAVGGEWGGAVLMAGEHAPQGRRTFFASFAQLGSPAGLILSLIAFRAVTSMDKADFLAWGWRLPFLASSVLLVVGILIRLGVN
ncbi:MFS transporter, partial [Bacillus subtilis]|nr:MFS transporter [Bacillus subtilis]